MKRKDQIVLLKDLVIPAGTVFSPSPVKTERDPDALFFDAVIGLSKDSYGTVTYCLDDDKEKLLGNWFAPLR